MLQTNFFIVGFHLPPSFDKEPLIINEVQLISVIVIFLLPFIYPKDEEEEIEEIVFP